MARDGESVPECSLLNHLQTDQLWPTSCGCCGIFISEAATAKNPRLLAGSTDAVNQLTWRSEVRINGGAWLLLTQPGNNGSDGSQGPQGAQGPPFAQAIVDGVATLDPSQPATVQTSFDGNNVRFTFGIPRGSDGSQGQQGNNGNDGAQGPQGPPGEISQAQLDNAISGTIANTNSVSTLDTGFADPDMEALRQKVNEMILNGRR